MYNKDWYRSKTLWVNTISGIAGIVQAITGEAWIDPGAQVGILALINMVLRAVTKNGLR